MNTLSLINRVKTLAFTGLGEEVGLQYEASRKKDGVHMNTWVGRVLMNDDEGPATFEYGVTDLQKRANGRRKRQEGMQHVYVLAQGPRAHTPKNTYL